MGIEIIGDSPILFKAYGVKYIPPSLLKESYLMISKIKKIPGPTFLIFVVLLIEIRAAAA